MPENDPTDRPTPDLAPPHIGPPMPPPIAPLARAALWVAVWGVFVPFLGLVAWLLGRKALDEIDRSEGTLDGRELARSGAMLGLASSALFGVIVAVGLALPFMGRRPHGHGNVPKNSSQLRGIHQSMVIFAQSNNSYFPGLDASGNILPDGPLTGYSGDGSTGSARLWVLLNVQFISGDLCLNPVETLTKWTTGAVSTANHSYAFLSIGRGTDTSGDAARAAEWKDNANSQAVLVGDRNTGADATDKKASSVWTAVAGDWKGNLVWGDNHAGFEQKQFPFVTRYAEHSATNDNLFVDGAIPGATESGTVRGANAFLLWD